jgi:hypothetical protein
MRGLQGPRLRSDSRRALPGRALSPWRVARPAVHSGSRRAFDVARVGTAARMRWGACVRRVSGGRALVSVTALRAGSDLSAASHVAAGAAERAGLRSARCRGAWTRGRSLRTPRASFGGVPTALREPARPTLLGCCPSGHRSSACASGRLPEAAAWSPPVRWLAGALGLAGAGVLRSGLGVWATSA